MRHRQLLKASVHTKPTTTSALTLFTSFSRLRMLFSYPVSLPVKQRPGLFQHLGIHLLLCQAIRKGRRVCMNLWWYSVSCFPGLAALRCAYHSFFFLAVLPNFSLRGTNLVRLVGGWNTNVRDGKSCRKPPRSEMRADRRRTSQVFEISRKQERLSVCEMAAKRDEAL